MAKSRLTIVGLGLIGGSIGLALKKAKLDLEIVGHDKDAGASARAQKRGAVDATKWNLIDACDGAGLIVLALPLDGIRDTLAALKPHLAPGVIVTDTATTKAAVLEWAKELPQGIHFVGGNPVIKPHRAAQQTGIDAADADLFQGATYCLAPAANASEQAINTLSNFCALLGAKPYFIDAAEHDGLMAGVQHLPALLATALLAATTRSQGWREMSRLAGADFYAATAVTPQDASAAREQLLAHRSDLIRWMDALGDELRELRGMLEHADADALAAFTQSAVNTRAQWLAGKAEESPSVEWEAVQMNVGRMFLGGLADKTKKTK
jgi:prephenate dehydrogenase